MGLLKVPLSTTVVVVADFLATAIHTLRLPTDVQTKLDFCHVRLAPDFGQVVPEILGLCIASTDGDKLRRPAMIAVAMKVRRMFATYHQVRCIAITRCTGLDPAITSRQK